MGSPSTCQKCRRGIAVEGETWCGGCLALDGSLASLKGNWWSSSHRRLGEEILIQAHRQLRAVKALDTSLQSFSDSWESKLKKAAAPAGQRPSHPVLPPRRPRLGGRNSPPATEFAGAGHREWERAEHRQATRSPRPRKRTRPQHRGGAKHQRHYRTHHDRGTGSHQRHSGASYPPRTIRGILDSDI